MGVGRGIFIIGFPLLATAAALALSIVILLGSTSRASGLHNVYYMKIDLSNIKTSAITGTDTSWLDSTAQGILRRFGVPNFYSTGVSGFCRGNSHGRFYRCETPSVPYWFDLFSILKKDTNTEHLNFQLPDKVGKYQDVLEKASKVMWIFYIIAAALLFIQLVIGFCTLGSKLMSCITSIVSLISTILMIIASGLGTGIHSVYRKYFNEQVNKYGITAKMGKTMLGLTWAASALCLWATVWWLFSICCGSTGRKRRSYIP